MPSEGEYEGLMGIGLTYARLFNELSYEKRQAFFNGGLTKKRNYEIDSRYYYRSEVLGVNAQAVIQKNDEVWKAFYELLKLRRQGRLPPHVEKISPPGYWKDRLTGKRIFIRSDRYYLEPRR
jgi:putative transposase